MYIWNTVKYSRVARCESREPNKGKLEERGSGQANANPRFRCVTLINYSKAATVQTPGSEHEDPGLSESNSASTYDKANWRAQAATLVHDQVMWFKHAGTGKDK